MDKKKKPDSLSIKEYLYYQRDTNHLLSIYYHPDFKRILLDGVFNRNPNEIIRLMQETKAYENYLIDIAVILFDQRNKE